jgi:ABC-type transport system involved in multi-copper enzyme maturation permease subunit
MKPYLAIIYDSFIEAAQSRVLWALIVAWVIVLSAVAPFGLVEGTTHEVQSDQILDRAKLTEILIEAANGKATPAQMAVWNVMKPGFQQTIIERQAVKRAGRIAMGELADGLNSVLDNADLYSEEAWPTAARRGALKDLLVAGKELSPVELQHRNRELLQLAFPGLIRSGESNLIWITYAGIKFNEPLPGIIKRKQIRPLFEAIVLMAVFKLGVGLVGILIGIIVTSPLVPDMFQAGSMHLLLSKPISRSGLLIAKFIGGAGFVFLNFSILLTGFYFLVGWRLGFWNQGILLCIPLLVFVFMIYYSVSMLVGLIWKNAVVSIVVTMLFWGICTVLGITYGVMRVVVTHTPEINHLVPLEDSVLTVSNNGQIRMWDRHASKWHEAYGTSFVDESVFGPFSLTKYHSLLFGKPRRLDFGTALQSEDVQLKIVNLRNDMAGSSNATKAEEKDSKTSKRSENSNPVPLWSDKRVDGGPAFPPRTRRIIVWNDTLAVLAERGLHYLDIDAATGEDKQDSSMIASLSKLFGNKKDNNYPLMTPEDWMPEPPLDLAWSEARKEFVVFSKGKLIVLEATDDRNFQPTPAIDLELPDDSLALLASNNRIALLATSASGVLRVDLDDPSNKSFITGTEKIVPRSLIASSVDGTFGLLDRDGVVWMIDADGKSCRRISFPIGEGISALTIDSNNDWWLAHSVRNVSRWNPKTEKTVEEFKPPRSWLEAIYYGVVEPLYTVNPKPAAVDAVMQKSLVSGNPLLFGRQTNELEVDRGPKEDPWFGVLSNIAFIAVMLAGGCWYLHRQDL